MTTGINHLFTTRRTASAMVNQGVKGTRKVEPTMPMAVMNRVFEQRTMLPPATGKRDSLYACGFRIGEAVGTLCVRLGFVSTPRPSLADTAPLRPQTPSVDRTVPVNPRLLRPYHPQRDFILDREVLRRAVLCACSLPLTKRLTTRLLRHAVLAELALAVAALLALAALGAPVTLEDILRQLTGLATVAVELLLVALVGALAAEILLSAFAVVQAALND